MDNNITISDISMANKDINTAKQMSEIILMSKDPELNYYAALHLSLNKKEHLKVIINSGNPLYNYKCIKHCTKTTALTNEEKKSFISKHIEIVLNSNNEKLIKELKHFLKYNRSQEQKPKLWDNSKKCKRRM